MFIFFKFVQIFFFKFVQTFVYFLQISTDFVCFFFKFVQIHVHIWRQSVIMVLWSFYGYIYIKHIFGNSCNCIDILYNVIIQIFECCWHMFRFFLFKWSTFWHTLVTHLNVSQSGCEMFMNTCNNGTVTMIGSFLWLYLFLVVWIAEFHKYMNASTHIVHCLGLMTRFCKYRYNYRCLRIDELRYYPESPLNWTLMGQFI